MRWAHGRQVCKQLDDGGPQQGLAADKIAVDSFCPQFSEGFHILETAAIVLILSAGHTYPAGRKTFPIDSWNLA